MKIPFECTVTPTLFFSETSSFIMMGCWAPHIPVRESEEEDDAEGWGLKPHLFVGWQKLANTTIAISHSRSLSDYTDLLWNVEVSVEGVWGVQGGRGWASEHRFFPPSARSTWPISWRAPVFYLHNRQNTGSPGWGVNLVSRKPRTTSCGIVHSWKTCVSAAVC